MSRIECIFLFEKIFWAMCQSIQLIINLVETISNVIVEFKQKLTSMSLMMTQLFNWHEILKISVIHDYLDRINKVFKLWSSFLESVNNDYEFFIIDLIVTLKLSYASSKSKRLNEEFHSYHIEKECLWTHSLKHQFLSQSYDLNYSDKE